MRKVEAMGYDTILVGKKEAIATVTLNRPQQMNALDLVMRKELISALTDLGADRTVRVLVLTGAGKAFCSGGDISTMDGVTAPAGRDRLKYVQQIVRLMLEMEKPIIASVNGVAVGAGLHIALAADIAIASENARFRETFVNIGLIPDLGGLYTLPLRVGLAKAKELMMTGRMIEAKEAESMGLVSRVVPHDLLKEETDKLAAMFAEGPPRVYAMIKSALNLWPMSLQAFLELEANMQSIAFATKDFEEGKKAFRERRKPVYTGE
jgi:2-(1,2-epoxy-1,2-dihydrophenyl)acetyl-CoA isomerase